MLTVQEGVNDVEWRAIPGYEGTYEVSDSGIVRSLDRTVHFRDGRVRRYVGQMLAQYEDDFGYKKSTLKLSGVSYRAHIHILVALAFIGPPPAPGLHVCHGDGNHQNNSPTNLRYDTVQGNSDDMVLHGTRLHGERAGSSKLKEADALAIRALRGKATCRELAAQFGTSPANVCNIQKRRRWIRLN